MLLAVFTILLVFCLADVAFGIVTNDPWSGLRLTKRFQQTCEKLKFTTPTQIQLDAIPPIVADKNVVVRSPTGSGKTAAYVLPLVQKLRRGNPMRPQPPIKTTRALILAPTRELVTQIASVCSDVTNFSNEQALTVETIYGGTSVRDQVKSLEEYKGVGPAILVATPGRLLDILDRNLVDLSQLQILVLDEADKMLGGQFQAEVDKILSKVLRDDVQKLAFSATYVGRASEVVRTKTRSEATIIIATPRRYAPRCSPSVSLSLL